MRGRLTSLLTMIALAFGLLVVPAIAQAQNDSGEAVVAQLYQQNAFETPDTDDHGKSNPDSGVPCQCQIHHHCCVGLQVDAIADASGLAVTSGPGVPSLIAALATFSQAPPTEPPAA